MRIAAIYTQSVGPLADGVISFKNDWTGKIESNILLTGPNGCGKSTLLLGIAMLWEALGFWLDYRKPLTAHHKAKKWFERCDKFAVIFNDIECSHYTPASFGFYFGNEQFIDELASEHPGVSWIGELTTSKSKNVLETKNGFFSDKNFDDWIKLLTMTRAQVVLGTLSTGLALSIPNTIYLDAEERRWVSPKRNISSLSQDDLNQRWLASYRVTDDWKGQFEASLFNMKAIMPDQYPEMINTLNQFLTGKEIEEEIHSGLRQQVTLANGKTHTFDELSSGEHQVLIMLFTIQRWLQPGGVVLIDEPDLHLHPSLISPLLASIENIVAKKNGQLIMTSHATDVWQRYDNLGLRIDLTHGKDAEDGRH